MLDPDPELGRVDDAERLTTLGRILRATSLDELPSLWNILRGDRSLVGPRPLLMRYLVRYTPEQARRHEVRPGLTGLAQVTGRNALSWERKFELDLQYVDDHSLRGDLTILWATVAKVLRRDGIAADGSHTMPEFMGTAVVMDSSLAGHTRESKGQRSKGQRSKGQRSMHRAPRRGWTALLARPNQVRGAGCSGASS
jgi:hypothetical protein